MLTEEDDSGSSSGGDASCCGRCDWIWFAQGRNGGTAICGGWPTEGDGQLLSHV